MAIAQDVGRTSALPRRERESVEACVAGRRRATGPAAFHVTATLLVLLALQSDLRAQEAYRLDTSTQQIVTETPQQWQSWHLPAGTVTVTADGVRSRRWKLNTNAVDDIVDFLRLNPPDGLAGKKPEEIELLDAIVAGSNREDVVNVFDGDPSTYWEPDPLDGADLRAKWWFTIDFGRIVVANRIVLRFVDEDLGDPFYLFDLLASEGFKPVRAPAGQTLDFAPVIHLDSPNTTQREYDIDLTGAAKYQRGVAIRFLQVAVYDSRQGRGREIGADEYERLRMEAPDEVGAIDYMKLLGDGQELAVSRENYDELPSEKRGPVRHFRRERPRLADIEVWQEGEDMARHTLDRGGSVTAVPPLEFSAEPMFDGDLQSTTYAAQRIPPNTDLGLSDPDFQVDLGSFFWIASVQVVQNLKGGFSMATFGPHEYAFSDGARRVDGSLQWEMARHVEDEFFATHSSVAAFTKVPLHPTGIHVERQRFDPPVRARFLRILYVDDDDVFVEKDDNFIPFTELRVFGEGYQPEVVVESPLMDPEGTRTLTSIEWDADVPPGTSITLQTRTSQTKSELTRYYNRVGDEVDSTFYAKNLFEWTEDTKIPDANLKGDIVSTVLLGSDASEWSEPYRHSGARVTSPSPRNFVQIRATLLSDTPDTAATLKSVRLNYTEPLADRLVGEMTPLRVNALAAEQPFSLYVRPDFSGANPGFDGLLLSAPPGMSLAFSKIYAGPVAGLAGPDGAAADYEIVDTDVAVTDVDSLLIRFPLITPASDVELLRLDFIGELFSVGGQLHIQARLEGDDDGKTVWQQIDEGDAAGDVEGNSLVVVAQQGQRQLLSSFDLPAAFSPNGDGVNDTAMLAFSVVLVGASRAVEVQVYDLSGRLVRTLSHRRDVSAGSYEIEWDGKNEAGATVAPGLYALRFHIDADDDGADLDQQDVIRTIAVAY